MTERRADLYGERLAVLETEVKGVRKDVAEIKEGQAERNGKLDDVRRSVHEIRNLMQLRDARDKATDTDVAALKGDVKQLTDLRTKLAGVLLVLTGAWYLGGSFVTEAIRRWWGSH